MCQVFLVKITKVLKKVLKIKNHNLKQLLLDLLAIFAGLFYQKNLYF